MTNQELVEKARKKVKNKKEFYRHFNAFCFVAFALFIINRAIAPDTWWFIFALAGWGMAVAGHYLNVFGFPSFRDAEWEERQLEIEIERMQSIEDLEDGDTLDLNEADTLELRGELQRSPRYKSDDLV